MSRWPSRTLTAAFVGAVAVNQVGLVLRDDLIASIGQLALAPVAGLRAYSRGAARTGLAAFGACFAADLIPKFLHGNAYTITYVGTFLGAQALFLATFWPTRHANGDFRRRAAIATTAAVAGGAVLLASGVPALTTAAALAYVGVEFVMAACSAATGLTGALGGLAMILCDVLVGAQGLALIPQSIPLACGVMLAYAAGLRLLAEAVPQPRR